MQNRVKMFSFPIKKMILIVIFYMSFSVCAWGQPLSQQLYDDIEDGRLDNFSRIEAAFIISGAETQTRLQQGVEWFNKILSDIREKNLIRFEKIPSAERLFMYFHTTWLKDYQKRATTLFDIMERREYNCVAATVLYNLTCDEVGLSTRAFETPTHVYTIFTNFAERVMVENTTSMGFNIMKNLHRYSQYLLRYYPQKKALKIGLDRLYWYENSNGREINNTELLGLICYNLSVFNAEKKNYSKAYEYVLLAQLFNQDSRSNRKFEIRLYYDWGQQLFEEKKYYQAFEVTADACYRYPDNDDFKANCQLAFGRALQQLWMNKDWDKAENIILEMDELDIRSERETAFQKNILTNWVSYFIAQNKKEEARRAIRLLKGDNE